MLRLQAGEDLGDSSQVAQALLDDVWYALRSPLNAFISFAETIHRLRAGEPGTAASGKYAVDIENSARLPRSQLGSIMAAAQARFDLATALDAAGDRDGAVEQLLELVRHDRKWNDDAARKQLVILFEAMGATDPRTIEARRKLSGLLFS